MDRYGFFSDVFWVQQRQSASHVGRSGHHAEFRLAPTSDAEIRHRHPHLRRLHYVNILQWQSFFSTFSMRSCHLMDSNRFCAGISTGQPICFTERINWWVKLRGIFCLNFAFAPTFFSGMLLWSTYPTLISVLCGISAVLWLSFFGCATESADEP